MEQSVCNKSGDKSGEIPFSRPMVHEIFDNFLPFPYGKISDVAYFQKDFSTFLKNKFCLLSKKISQVLHVCTLVYIV